VRNGVDALPVEDTLAIGGIMREFYGRLGKDAPAEALRAAQVKSIADGVPPTVWAAFAVVAV
jgi:CHAT domain-containing protein